MKMPEKIWAVTPSSENGCVVSFTTQSLDYKHPYIRSDIAEELARAALQVIENYGFTSDGNDRYREVEIGNINDLDNALARFRALTP